MITSLFDSILPSMLSFDFNNLKSHGELSDGMAFASEHAYNVYLATQTQYPSQFHKPWILYGKQDERENAQLRIAIVLCHELAHIVWIFRAGGSCMVFADGSSLKEPLHCPNDCEAELGYSWENHVFGGAIWAIDHPGIFIAYYEDNVMLFRKSTWDNFEELYTTHQLRLPGVTESDFNFQAEDPNKPSLWTLYKKGVKQQDCTMSENPPFIVWTNVRPRLERLRLANTHIYANAIQNSDEPREGSTQAVVSSSATISAGMMELSVIITSLASTASQSTHEHSGKRADSPMALDVETLSLDASEPSTG
ncbi:hypothetical protein T440DRAFT_482687 [Plenodomus tracheiphilus IPT5]|uniref:Uncharacterized protein n=1 Tax=Plenodomus tracheiphilus IPT5 TaxID=1408161 RepID=A0A6A7AU86_9PLEO|nr:hypothetical protein T440DRAFT_482687 [Plenodomus tracheiphilus IPT5]